MSFITSILLPYCPFSWAIFLLILLISYLKLVCVHGWQFHDQKTMLLLHWNPFYIHLENELVNFNIVFCPYIQSAPSFKSKIRIALSQGLPFSKYNSLQLCEPVLCACLPVCMVVCVCVRIQRLVHMRSLCVLFFIFKYCSGTFWQLKHEWKQLCWVLYWWRVWEFTVLIIISILLGTDGFEWVNLT